MTVSCQTISLGVLTIGFYAEPPFPRIPRRLLAATAAQRQFELDELDPATTLSTHFGEIGAVRITGPGPRQLGGVRHAGITVQIYIYDLFDAVREHGGVEAVRPRLTDWQKQAMQHVECLA
jgi:hypothetical protein